MIPDAVIALMPPFQAAMNALAIVLLGAGFYFIRTGNRVMHRNCMIVTLVVSSVFLASYVTYHALVGYQPFAGEGLIRPFYFTLLGSHIVLAAIIVPLVLATVWFAARGRFDRHPRIARWTLPIWMYVSISGVIIYVLGFHVYAPAAS